MFTSSFDLDLFEAGIIEIIDVYVDFKRQSNPNAGYRTSGLLMNKESCVYYWSTSLHVNPNFAYYMYFDKWGCRCIMALAALVFIPVCFFSRI